MAQTAAPVRSIGERLRAHWRGIAVICALVLILGSLALAMLKNQTEQADRRYSEAVREADRLDPGWRLDDILAQCEKVPEKENSAVRLREIAAGLPGAWAGIKEYDRSFALEGEAPEVRLSAERIQQLRSALEGAEDVVSEARELARFPRGSVDGVRPKVVRWEQVGNLNAYVDVNFPYSEHLHRVLFLLWLDAKLQIEAGDMETALVDVRAMVNAGRSVGDYPGLSAQMARAGALRQAIQCLETTLAQGQAAGTSLAPLQSILEDEAKQPARSIALRGERAIIDDLFERIVAGKLSPSAIPSFNDYPFWERAFSHRINIRENQATLLRLHTRAVEETRLPESEQLAAMKARNDEWVAQAIQWGFLEKQRRLTERLLLGMASGVAMWLGINDAQLRTTAAALAAERFRIDHGRWPDSLDQLVPKYISAVPRDPFVDAPLKFKKIPEGLFIYSVGYDAKDDGGKFDPKKPAGFGPDMGFRLLDVSRRRQAAAKANTNALPGTP